MLTEESNTVNWPLSHKILFRFFAIYFILNISPWEWLNRIPGIGYLLGLYDQAFSWIVEKFNTLWFHFAQTTVINNGSGDTSVNWEYVFTYLILAAIGTLGWSILDHKRKNYTIADYWLRTIIRYSLIISCISYAIYKLYYLQMPFPNQSQLATPLGDFLPMRFSWMFIGYSSPYEMFSGAMELLAGLLLLNRRTITLGIFIATAVFINVMVLNLCYDIPVKIFSIHLVLYSLYLLVNDSKRLIDFFILNRPAVSNIAYQPGLPKKWMRITRIVLKLAFVVFFVLLPFYDIHQYALARMKTVTIKPLTPGIYDVTVFAVNKDTIPGLQSDSLRWKDVIFETDGTGSVASADTAFRQRYHRGYFNIVVDSTNKVTGLQKSSRSTGMIVNFHRILSDSNTIKIWGSKNSDSLYVVLKKSNRHFQLAEKQFHWISEANR